MTSSPHATYADVQNAAAAGVPLSFISSPSDRDSGLASLLRRCAMALAVSLPLVLSGCFNDSTSSSNVSANQVASTNVDSTVTPGATTNGQVTTTPATSTSTPSSSSSTVAVPASGSSAPAAAINAKPAIVGAPGTTVLVGNAYTFTPVGSDADGDTLTYSIVNKPSWITFNAANGTLTGKPTAADVGTYSNVVVSVSDGKVQTSLAKFTLSVVAVAAGSTTISWTAPTQNVDGTTISSLAGYKIYYGTSEDALTQVAVVSNPSLTRYVIENLMPATYYFSVVSVGAAGGESRRSGVVSTTVS